MKCEWNAYTVQQLIDMGMLEPPIDGNHGAIHPKASDYVANGIPFIMANDLVNGKINYHSCAFITESQAATLRKGFAKPGDILLTHKATIGRTAIVSSEYDTIILTPQVTYYRVIKGLNRHYLKYYFDSNTFQQLFSNWAGAGSTRAYLGITAQRKLPIIVPPIEIQDAIADICGSLDDKIELNNKINDNLYEMVNVYYASLFKDVECEMTTIGNYAERIYSGGTPTTSNATYWDGSFGWFSSGETRNRFVISTEKTITQAGIDNSSTKLAAKHDIVMASAGQGFTRGQTSMLLLDTYINQSVIVIHAERNILPYLFWNLANRYEELRAISDSSSIRGSLTTKMIASFEIPLANEESLQAFADFSWSVIPQIENNLLENERLADLRDSLLPKLMSGELDVSDIRL